jgi:hypothetical protein
MGLLSSWSGEGTSPITGYAIELWRGLMCGKAMPFGRASESFAARAEFEMEQLISSEMRLRVTQKEVLELTNKEVIRRF